MITKQALQQLFVIFSLSAVILLIYGVYYTKADQNRKSAVIVAANQGFRVHHLSPELSEGIKNAELEKDVQTVQKDIRHIKTGISIETVLVQPKTIARISPEDAADLAERYAQDVDPFKEATYSQIATLYLQAALIDRQTTLSDKLLPRYQAIPAVAGQRKTVNDLYGKIRTNLNTMRNRNADAYFELTEPTTGGEAKAPALSANVLELAQENQEMISAIIPLIRPFELP